MTATIRYRPSVPDVWREGNERPYGDLERKWRHQVRCIDMDVNTPEPQECRIALLGFACDEGVRRNWGRIGAREGPEALRKALGQLSWHCGNDDGVTDAGDVFCPDGDLHASQLELKRRVSHLLSVGYLPVLIGGGHEIAWGHYLGITDFASEMRIGIINIDAHFDLRKPDENGGNSGTSFFQIAEYCQRHESDLAYLCVGVEKRSNSKELFRTAALHGAEWIAADRTNMGNIETLQAEIDRFIARVDRVYLTLCLDALNAACAPGVSAPNPIGLSPEIVAALYRHIFKSGKAISTDIAELSPSHDIDRRTARLAAAMVFQIAENC